jgi:hypothetical protein
MSSRLGDSKPCVPEGTALGEHSQLSMAPGEVSMGGHGRQDNPAQTFVVLRTFEGHHSLPEAVDRLPILALDPVREAELLIRECL